MVALNLSLIHAKKSIDLKMEILRLVGQKERAAAIERVLTALNDDAICGSGMREKFHLTLGQAARIPKIKAAIDKKHGRRLAAAKRRPK
jgi:hypothetical protein